jgi:AcrR family transcriptional regulator
MTMDAMPNESGRATAKSQIKSQVEDQRLLAERWAQIAEAARDCFEAQGFHATTIKDIAKRAGISSGLIYHYVENKQDVLVLVILEVFRSYQREIPAALIGLQDPLERVRAAAIAYCRVVAARIDAALLAYQETKALDAERQGLIKNMELETNELIAECVRDCLEAGYFEPCEDELATYRIVMMAHSWALKGWRLKEVASFEEYVDDSLAFLMRGLLNAKGRHHYTTKLGFALEAGA